MFENLQNCKNRRKTSSFSSLNNPVEKYKVHRSIELFESIFLAFLRVKNGHNETVTTQNSLCTKIMFVPLIFFPPIFHRFFRPWKSVLYSAKRKFVYESQRFLTPQTLCRTSRSFALLCRRKQYSFSIFFVERANRTISKFDLRFARFKKTVQQNCNNNNNEIQTKLERIDLLCRVN